MSCNQVCDRCKQLAHKDHIRTIKSGHSICSDCYNILQARNEPRPPKHEMVTIKEDITGICPHCGTYCYGDC